MQLRQIREEPANPVDVGALGAVGVVARPEAQPELLDGRQRINRAVFAPDAACRTAAPVGSLEEVDELDLEGLPGLADLPTLDSAAPFEILAKVPDLVGKRLVGSWAVEELPNPSDEVRRGAWLDHLGLEQELTVLLEGGFGVTHGASRAGGEQHASHP